MLPDIPRDCRVIVIEGIPGSGKTTLARRLQEDTGGRAVAAFSESALLHGWKHGYLPGIHALRLQLYHAVLDHVETQPGHDMLFVLTRFHLSYALLGGDIANPRYREVIERLARLRAHVLVPVVEEDAIESRAAHVERTDHEWRPYLQRRMAEAGCSDLRALYGNYQADLQQLLASQPLPHTYLPPFTP
jgi:hypothetical protein